MKTKVATPSFTANEWILWLRFFRNHRRELATEESLALRDAIKTYPSVAEEFFFRTLDPMTKGFAHKVYETYNVVVDFRDIATCIYIAMYDGCKWTRLNAYRGDCGLFAWIAYCGTQSVFTELEDLHYIETNTELNSKNTSLTLKSMRNKDEVMMVLDLIEVPQMHELLTRIYVMRMTEEEVMDKMNMSEELFKKTRKVAETMLKESLIHEEMMLVEREDGKVVNLVTEALSDLSGKIKTSTSDEAMLAADKMFSDDEYDEIKEVLQLKYPNMDPHAMWDQFVKDQALVCGMTEDQLDVWTARYIDHESPVSVAERLGMRRSNVDNLFSHANKVLEDHIRNWWRKNS